MTIGPTAVLLTQAQPKSYAAAKVIKPEPPADVDVLMMIKDHPSMIASTFYNLLKSKGFKIVPDEDRIAPPGEPATQADTSSGFVQMTRAGTKESIKTYFGLKFLELDKSPKDKAVGFTKFKVVLLAEGMGNFANAFYYPKSALDSSIPVFEGKKIYADHPSLSEEKDRPERSVRDVLGHFENVHTEEVDGQSLLVADVIIPPDQPFLWARSLMGHAVVYSEKYPDKSFIGLSINANGEAVEQEIEEVMKTAPKSALPKLQDALSQGIKKLRVVNSITEATSVDLVTEAGAGGKILSFIERNKNMEKVEKDPAPAGHADAAQDIELIKKMITKYLGEEPAPSDEECDMVKKAKQAYEEMGEDEADAKAVGALKLARHMAAKQPPPPQAKPEAKEQEACQDEPAKEEECKQAEKKEAEEKKESDKKLHAELLKLKGELAKYQEAHKTQELLVYLDKKLKETKLSTEVTKKFRETLGAPKSKEQIDSMFNIFMEGYSSSRAAAIDWSFVTQGTTRENAVGKSTRKINFEGITK